MRRSRISILLCLCLLAGLLSGCGRSGKDANTAVNVVEGTAGATDSENFENLFDCDKNTKWCVTGFEGAYVIWGTSSKVTPTGYTIVTANDNTTYNGRNPASWQLYGSSARRAPDRDGKGWELVDAISGDTVLQDVNYTEYHYDITGVSGKYRYFMLVVTQTQGAGVMQLSEFALEYDGASYEFSGGSGSAGGDTAAQTGSTYISDGMTYTLQAGESLTFYNPRTPTSSTYSYNWFVTEGEQYVETDPDGPTCRVTGLDVGSVTILAVLDYSVQLASSWEQYSYEYTITVNVVENTGEDSRYGSVTDGMCPRCHGAGTVDCSVCYGDGRLTNGTLCTNCVNGKVTCPFCDGTGTWS